MKDIVSTIMIIIFYGMGAILFLFMFLSQRKQTKLIREYWEEELKQLRMKNIERRK